MHRIGRFTWRFRGTLGTRRFSEPEQTLALCRPLVQQIVLEVERISFGFRGERHPQAILLTRPAELLQGLVPPSYVKSLQMDAGRTWPPRSGDGKELFSARISFAKLWRGNVIVLSPDAPARAAHRLADYFRNDRPERSPR